MSRHRGPSAALVMDLKERGLLDDTLVIWGGEFGRTPFGQGNPAAPNGRDHFGRSLQLVAGWRWNKSRYDLWCYDDFAWTSSQKILFMFTTCKHAHAFVWHRPYAFDVPVSGAAISSDRYPRQGRRRDLCLDPRSNSFPQLLIRANSYRPTKLF